MTYSPVSCSGYVCLPKGSKTVFDTIKAPKNVYIFVKSVDINLLGIFYNKDWSKFYMSTCASSSKREV